MEVASHQDYLYMVQTCIALSALVAVFLVFRYEAIDRYADNRKAALREILDIKGHPERAEWIQQIGKADIGFRTFDAELLALNIPSVKPFIEEIVHLRTKRHCLVFWGKLIAFVWVGMAILYLFAQTLNWYSPYSAYLLLMLAFLAPLVASCIFFWWALQFIH